jgi:hypothetical protein
MRKIFFIVLFFLSDILFAVVTKQVGDKKAIFVNMSDNGINNVSYYCNGEERNIVDGKTGVYTENSKTIYEDGVFIFNTGCSPITFSIKGDSGDEIILGRVPTNSLDGSSEDYKLFITELAGTSRTNSTHQGAINIARLLYSLDINENIKDNIDINSSEIDNNLGLANSNEPIDENTNPDDLNNTVNKQFPGRALLSKLCVQVHMERALRDNGYTTVDTVPPCRPELVFDLNATSNSVTYIELSGEENTNIHLNGVDTGYDMDEDGNFAEFQLSTPIELNSYDQFNFTLVDQTGKQSQINPIQIFNDPDQPHFNNLPDIWNVNTSSTLDLNVSDTSKDHNLTDFPKLSLKYEVLDNNVSGDKNNFSINSNGILSTSASSGFPYYIRIKVTDQVLHYVEANLTVIKQ